MFGGRPTYAGVHMLMTLSSHATVSILVTSLEVIWVFHPGVCHASYTIEHRSEWSELV